MKNINKPKKGIKKTNTKDKNGFTLVELLAVIVVLAMLVLIAGRAVTGQIIKAKRNTFRTETIEFAKGMLDSRDMFYFECKDLTELKDEGYIEFSSTSGYSGYVAVIQAISRSDGYNDGTIYDKEVFIRITNGRYSYDSVSESGWPTITLSRITADKKFEKQTKNASGTSIPDDSCPTKITMVGQLIYTQDNPGWLEPSE